MTEEQAQNMIESFGRIEALLALLVTNQGRPGRMMSEQVGAVLNGQITAEEVANEMSSGRRPGARP